MREMTVVIRVLSTDRSHPQPEVKHHNVLMVQQGAPPNALANFITLMDSAGDVLTSGNVVNFDLGYPGASFHMKFRVMAVHEQNDGLTTYRREDWYVTFPPLP